MYDVAIIGGGPAGLSAAMYAGRLKLKTLVLTKERGGTILNASEIMNWPGIKKIDGVSLAKQLEEHALDYSYVEIKDAMVARIKKKKDNFLVETQSGEYEAKSVIFAAGTEVRKLGIPGEENYVGRGVHYCALCDGFFYSGKTICVIGGSDSAAKEALLLTQWAKKVYIIYRGEKIRAEPVNLEKVEKNGKIEIINKTNVVEIKGNESIENLVLDKPYKGKKELALDGIFVEIGRVPATVLVKDVGVKLNEKGEVITDKEAKTNVPGFFAAGDITDSKFKQAITASAEGVAAAFSAYVYLQKKG
ncbi:FAD-dependent oxidoreductase [Candidatus Micrarchaeota archaeon]|nr:FAD-dependent oxidoreductase [Candidatus Micrarchaeota archaeon]